MQQFLRVQDPKKIDRDQKKTNPRFPSPWVLKAVLTQNLKEMPPYLPPSFLACIQQQISSLQPSHIGQRSIPTSPVWLLAPWHSNGPAPELQHCLKLHRRTPHGHQVSKGWGVGCWAVQLKLFKFTNSFWRRFLGNERLNLKNALGPRPLPRTGCK